MRVSDKALKKEKKHHGDVIISVLYLHQCPHVGIGLCVMWLSPGSGLTKPSLHTVWQPYLICQTGSQQLFSNYAQIHWCPVRKLQHEVSQTPPSGILVAAWHRFLAPVLISVKLYLSHLKRTSTTTQKYCGRRPRLSLSSHRRKVLHPDPLS